MLVYHTSSLVCYQVVRQAPNLRVTAGRKNHHLLWRLASKNGASQPKSHFDVKCLT